MSDRVASGGILLFCLLLLICGIATGLIANIVNSDIKIQRIMDTQEIKIQKIMAAQEEKTRKIVHQEVDVAVAAAIEKFKSEIDKSCHDSGAYLTDKYRLKCWLRK